MTELSGRRGGECVPLTLGAEPYYSDEFVTLFRGDARKWDTPDVAQMVVTSPPYNVGIDYDGHDDSMPWPDYWSLARDVCEVIARALTSTGRCWVNVAPVVQEQPGGAGRNGGPHSGRSRKDRASLIQGWSNWLTNAGLKPCDVIAWTSQRGSGTAWGSWQSPSAPNVRGDWEAVLVHYLDEWPRTPPAGMEGWKDTLGNWPALVSNVWSIRPDFDRTGHPVPYPVELAARAIRLSTWPGETVFDPFAGAGSSLVAAKALGRRAIGIEQSERYCEQAATRLSQGLLDFGGVA